MVKITNSRLEFTKSSSLFLDAVRVLASQGVLFGHAISFYGIFEYIQPPKGIYIQNIAVVIFFIVSGLLIAKNLVRAYQKNDFLEYFSDRFVRIYTTFVSCLIFIVCIDFIHKYYYQDHFAYNNALDLKTFFGNILMLQDYPIGHSVTSFGSGRPLWTLAIEWWLYMAAGFFVYLFRNFNFLYKTNKILCMGLFFISSIVPFCNLCSGRGACLTLFWLLGCLLYFLLSRNAVEIHAFFSKNGQRNLIYFFFFIPLYFVYKIRTEYDLRIGVAFGCSLYYVLIYTQRYSVSFFIKLKKQISFMASFSFTLYLVHYSVLDFLSIYSGVVNRYLLTISSLIISNLIAIVLYFFVERNYKIYQQKIRGTFFYKKMDSFLDRFKNQQIFSYASVAN